MATFKYKILEFKPGDKMEKAFNDLGKEGWELVSVTPVGLSVKGDYDATFGGVGNGETEGKFDKIAAYFKSQLVMGNNQYTDLWEKYRPVIIKLIKNGGGQYPLYKGEFEQRGNRDKYSFSMTVEDGKVPELGGSAVARDLKAVLDGSESFRKYAVGKTIGIRLTSSYTLEVSVS